MFGGGASLAEILLWMAMTAATVLSCVVCHNNWSLGIFCTILTGLLQEPLRKAIPGQPPWIHVAFLFPATFCVWRMMTIDRAGTTSRALCGELNGLKLPLVLAGTAILTASFARFSSGITAVNLKLVLLGWLGPVMLTIGCLIGARWAVASKADAVDSAIKLLCLTLTVFLAGHLLELNPAVYETNPAIGPLPPHRPWYRTIGAEQFRMFSGFFRSPDTAGWFAALQVSCAILASLTRDRTRARSLVFWKLSWFWLGVGAFGGFCCLLSGRRKMQVLLMLCLALGGVLQWIAGKYAPARQFWLRGLMVVALAVGFVSLVPQAEMYLSYFRTSPELAPARLVRETVAPIIGYSSEVSVFGLGLGAMTPGCQHVGGALPKRESNRPKSFAPPRR